VSGDGHMKWVEYEVPNPEWERVSDIASTAANPADTLRGSLDKAYGSWSGALVSDALPRPI